MDPFLLLSAPPDSIFARDWAKLGFSATIKAIATMVIACRVGPIGNKQVRTEIKIYRDTAE